MWIGMIKWSPTTSITSNTTRTNARNCGMVLRNICLSRILVYHSVNSAAALYGEIRFDWIIGINSSMRDCVASLL